MASQYSDWQRKTFAKKKEKLFLVVCICKKKIFFDVFLEKKKKRKEKTDIFFHSVILVAKKKKKRNKEKKISHQEDGHKKPLRSKLIESGIERTNVCLWRRRWWSTSVSTFHVCKGTTASMKRSCRSAANRVDIYHCFNTNSFIHTFDILEHLCFHCNAPSFWDIT